MRKLEHIPFRLKYKPNSLVKDAGKIPIILLPRIRQAMDASLHNNFLFYGSGGLGKSCLANILTENTDCLWLNSSDDNGKDIVKERITPHCTTYGIFGKDAIKTVVFEEFDGTTPQFRKALRGFIDDMDIKKIPVVFIATANNINKIYQTEEDKACLSRFIRINFDPQNAEEKQYLIKNQIAFIKGIVNREKGNVPDAIIEKLVNSFFPNFRDSIQQVQEILLAGENANVLSTDSNTQKYDIFDFILDQDNTVSDNYFYVMDNYKDQTNELIRILTRPLFSYLLEKKPDFITKNGEKLLHLAKEYNAEYSNTLDPEMHLISYITKIKTLLQE